MSKEDKQKAVPIIHQTREVAKSRFFRIEEVDLEFSNGATRIFERMAGGGRGAVMIIPLLDANTMLLIREYAAGTHSYQLGFPKGLIDPGESPDQAANRELQEEVGYAAKEFTALKQVLMAPTFFNAGMHIIIAQDLYPSQLEGDEPEPLEVVPWPIDEIDALLALPDFSEARSVAALLMLDRWRKNQ
ncbi:ADP compounds hydrolase NudE [Glaciecola sp. 1036]|uniref:ADP compounds hydrolase NudE n=1 Tax=Alteromonadaceae TaxID=72275 RepID=UPI003D093503